MPLDPDTQSQLAIALANPYLAGNLVSVINAAVSDSGVISIGGATGVITAAAGRTALGLGTAATQASSVFQAASPVLATAVAAAPVAVTGSKASGAALASLLAALVTLGWITDGTSA
jgi:hypothetical protein